MAIKTTSQNIGLYADLFNEYLKAIAKPNNSLPDPYRLPAAATADFSMSSLRTGQSMWTNLGESAASVADSIGPSPTNLPFGTFTSLSAYTDFAQRNARTSIYSTAQNMKMSQYRGSFFPYYGNIVHTSYSDTTYTIGQGKFWLKFTCIGGGGGGGGGDGFNDANIGGIGGSGTQISMTCYVASNNANQAIRIFVGEGGAGGYTYPGGRGFWSVYNKPAGGRGWKNGGQGGRPLRAGGSGYGGGGGGASAIVWYPEGTGAQGYFLGFAGGGGGGGGAGQWNHNIEAGYFPPNIDAGGYSLFSSTTTYPKYSKNGNEAGVGNFDTNNGYTFNRGDTSDLNNITGDGFSGLGADNFYTNYYKPYFQDVHGGSFTTYVNQFPVASASQLDGFMTGFDGGGSGGGGGGGGLPGFLPPFYIITTYTTDAYGITTSSQDFSFVQLETGGGGGCAGFIYSSATNITGANFEFAWRNKTSGYTQNQGPSNSVSQFVVNTSAGYGGTAGKGSLFEDGGKGYDGAVLLSITNADHEGGLYNNSISL